MESGPSKRQHDPSQRRQAAAAALWIPVGFGIGSFALAGARTGRQRVLDRAASVRGLVVAVLAAGAVAAARWRWGETRREAELRRLFTAQRSPMEVALSLTGRAFLYGALDVVGAGLGLLAGTATSVEHRGPIPDFAPRRIPIAIFEASLLSAGALVAVYELTRAVRREASTQPRLRRARTLQLPPEPAIVAPGTAEEAFGTLDGDVPLS